MFHSNPSRYLPRMSRIYPLLAFVLCPSSFWKILLSFIVLSLYLYLSFFAIFPLSLSCHNSLVIIKSFQLIEVTEVTQIKRCFCLSSFISRTAHTKSFPLRIFSVNVTKYAGNFRFGHIY